MTSIYLTGFLFTLITTLIYAFFVLKHDIKASHAVLICLGLSVIWIALVPVALIVYGIVFGIRHVKNRVA